MDITTKVFAITRTEGTKKVANGVERGSLGLETIAKSVVCKMITDDDPTFFTMNAKELCIIFRILAGLAGKTHIDTEALPRTCSFLGGTSARSFRLYRAYAGGTTF